MNKLLKTTILAVIILMLIQVTVFAETLNINIKANKQKVNVGETVKITVSWDKGMQAADFILNYDADKLEFVKSDLEDDYINDRSGKLRTAWFSIDDTDKTKIEYTFKAKETGTAEFETKVNGGFATGTLSMPTEYNEGKLQLEISEANPILNVLKTVLCIIVILLILVIIVNKTKNNKKHRVTKKEKLK